MVGIGGKHLDQRFWSIGVSSVSLSLSLANGFHEKASLVKVNVVTKASTIQGETPFAKLPFAVNRLQVVADGASNRPDPGLW
jgi:hypothetical protein